MSRFPVSTEKERELEDQMARLGILEQDLNEQFVRSGGHGGQNVNKASTCVVLTHRPSGLQVKCQKERSQGLNRFFARRILADRIEAAQLGRESAERSRVEKIRRQKRRRSRRAKLKMLANKRHRSHIKIERRRNEDF